jgi:hypothetical protein
LKLDEKNLNSDLKFGFEGKEILTSFGHQNWTWLRKSIMHAMQS